MIRGGRRSVLALTVTSVLSSFDFASTALAHRPGLPMPETSPYHCSWWYRTEFRLPASFRGRHTALHFDGINYRANIWLNGKQIANSNDITGMWRLFELDATNTLVPGVNTLAVEVF